MPDEKPLSNFTSPGNQLFGYFEHGIQHRLGQSARESVLLTGVIAAKQPSAAVQFNRFSVRELGAFLWTVKPTSSEIDVSWVQNQTLREKTVLAEQIPDKTRFFAVGFRFTSEKTDFSDWVQFSGIVVNRQRCIPAFHSQVE